MIAVTIDLDKEMKRNLDEISSGAGLTVQETIRKALLSYIEGQQARGARDVSHCIVNELPESELLAAQRFLEYLRDHAFDEPLTPEEESESKTAWQAYLSNEDQGEPLEEIRRELLR